MQKLKEKSNLNSSMMEIIERCWRLPRDIVSDGYDRALIELAKQIPLTIHKYPTGTACWTWQIPEKWTCHEAYLETLDGKRLFSYSDNPLHVVSYSLPFDGIVNREELFKHLHTHAQLPQAIPFKFCYYERDWGLCCSQSLKDDLKDDKYKVKIKTDFSAGELKVGEVIIPGQVKQSIVLCAHLCHPAMVNDDLTGVVVGIEVLRRLKERKNLYHTYRFLILPETIGSIAWLSHNEELIPHIKGGLFLEMLGTDLPHSLQLSFAGDTQIDRCFVDALKTNDPQSWVGTYHTVVWNDEKQFNAPGVRIPMLSLSRVSFENHEVSPYPEYHTSFDSPEIVSAARLEESVRMALAMIETHENNYYVINKFKGEIFLSRYGIHIDYYTNPAGHKNLFAIMNKIDGTRTVMDIARECSITFEACLDVINKFHKNGLVELRREPG
ncbi:DUF4910 domain-containing protein [Candidatus Margulisiibacteriota bacterium]